MMVITIIGGIIAVLGFIIFWRYASRGDGNDVPPIGLFFCFAGIIVAVLGCFIE